jgi:hypothetical protein
MSTMFIDDSTAKALVLLAMAIVSVALVRGSRHQPFPEISGRFGWFLLSMTGVLALGEQAPRPMSLNILLAIVLVLGSYGILVGVHHMVRTRRDVFIAPMSGFLFCTGGGGLMVLTWPDLTKPGWCSEGCLSADFHLLGVRPAWWPCSDANSMARMGPFHALNEGGMPMKNI